MDITECVVGEDGELEYRTLYRYQIRDNVYIDGQFYIDGKFVKENPPSQNLIAKLMRGGVPQEVLEQFM